MPGGKSAQGFLRFLYDQFVQKPSDAMAQNIGAIQQLGNTSPQTFPSDLMNAGLAGIGIVASPFTTVSQPLEKAVSSATAPGVGEAMGAIAPMGVTRNALRMHEFARLNKIAKASEAPNIAKMAGAFGDEAASPEKIIKGMGLRYVGVQKWPGKKDFIMFDEPNTGSTIGLFADEVSPENIAKKLAETRAKFGVQSPPGQPGFKAGDIAANVTSGMKAAVGSVKSWKPAKPTNTLQSESGYVYHATNTDRAGEISASALKTHRPHEFTDQSVWPDGSSEMRSYWSNRADNVLQFAPEEGTGAILRTKKSNKFRSESGTGDIFTKEKIDPSEIEILGDDGAWHPLRDLNKKK